MPFRLDAEKYGEFRAKIQFTTAAWMPYMIYQACVKVGIISNTRYCQIAVAEKLARDLDLDVEELITRLPRTRSLAGHLFDPTKALPGRPPATPRVNPPLYEQIKVNRYGMGNTYEEIGKPDDHPL